MCKYIRIAKVGQNFPNDSWMQLIWPKCMWKSKLPKLVKLPTKWNLLCNFAFKSATQGKQGTWWLDLGQQFHVQVNLYLHIFAKYVLIISEFKRRERCHNESWTQLIWPKICVKNQPWGLLICSTAVRSFLTLGYRSTRGRQESWPTGLNLHIYALHMTIASRSKVRIPGNDAWKRTFIWNYKHTKQYMFAPIQNHNFKEYVGSMYMPFHLRTYFHET